MSSTPSQTLKVNSLTAIDNVVLNLERAMNDHPANTLPILERIKNATNGIETTTMVSNVKATLHAAQAAEKLVAVSTQIAEFFPILTKVFDQIRLNDQNREAVKQLQVMIAADLLILRKSQIALHFTSLAQIAANSLKEIPIPNDDLLAEVVITLHEGMDTLPKTFPIPVAAETSIRSPASSSTTSTIDSDEDAALRKDLLTLKRRIQHFEPPAKPAMFRLPESYNTTLPKHDNDIGYRHQLIVELWESATPSAYPYLGEDIPIVEYGPPHHRIFISRKEHGPVVWASTKRALAKAMATNDYDGLSDDDSN
jgi:hypothetical protein